MSSANVSQIAQARRAPPDLRDRAFLPAAVCIIETPPSPIGLALMLSICALVVAAIAWCWFGRIEIYATARGKIEPEGHAKVVQPLDPGKVSQINVVSGQSVRSGEILLTIDPSEIEAAIVAASEQVTSARAEAARRQAAVATMTTGNLRGQIAIIWPDDITESVRRREESVLAGDLKEFAAKLDSLAAQRVEREAAVKQLEGSIAAEQSLLEVLNERVVLRQTLLDKAAGTRTSLLDAMQVERETKMQLAGDIGRKNQAIAAVSSLLAEQSQTIETFIAENTRKISDARRLADEKSADQGMLRVRLERTILRAPVDGVVQSLAVTTRGQVVTTGQELMRIVPANAPVAIQAYVTNEDIGFVSPGQKAVVKIDSFPYVRYGTLEATVEEVANDAIPADGANRALANPINKGEERGQSLSPTAKPLTDLVFEAKLRPGRYTVPVNGHEVALSPGMTLTIEIKTGSRRILEYLFSPLVEIAHTSMRER